MTKLKLTKNELKRQKDALKRFRRYLPVLLLKKQQLQLEVVKLHNLLDELEKEMELLGKGIYKWVSVFSEDIGFKDLISVKKIAIKTGNIAGLDIPVFEGVEFNEKEYEFIEFPVWVDYGIEAAKKMSVLKAKHKILEEQIGLLREELRTTTQRVNLFEKVKIPEARENIRKVNIWLGDQQTAAVVTGKIAKTKIQRKESVLT